MWPETDFNLFNLINVIKKKKYLMLGDQLKQKRAVWQCGTDYYSWDNCDNSYETRNMKEKTKIR